MKNSLFNCSISQSFVKFFTLILLILMSWSGWGQAAVLFSQDFESTAWNTPAGLSPAWTSVGTINNQWQMNSYTSGWTSAYGSYSPTGIGLQSARFHSYDAALGTTGDLITPTINMSTSGADNKTLLFWMINTGTGTDVLNVYLSTDNGVTWGSSLGNFGNYNSWTPLNVSLGNTSSSTVKIKFTATADYGLSDIGIDQVIILDRNAQAFSTTGPSSFTVPNGICTVNAECFGGGGGGGRANGTSSAAGGGGGGGYSNKTFTGLTGGTSLIYLNVGIGGAGSTTNGTSGSAGGVSWANTINQQPTTNDGALAYGGGGGAFANTASGSGAGGAGGVVGFGDGTLRTGGNGGAGVSGTNTASSGGGGGGGSAGSTGNGSGAATTTTTSKTGFAGIAPGGKGADGGNNQTGANGKGFGAGGSGGHKNTNTNSGGSGCQGLVIISWSTPTASSAPTVSLPIACDATVVNGTSSEANGTVIEVFNGATSLGTTTVSSGAWTKSGLTALAGGATITAKATANCKTVSAASSAVTVSACTNPLITVSATSLTAFNSCAGVSSSSSTFTVSASNLGSNDLTVTPPTGFEISSDGGVNYVNSSTTPAFLTFTPSSGTVSSQTITVRMMALSSAPTAATISCVATGATTKTVSVSGTVMNNLNSSTLTYTNPNIVACTSAAITASTASLSPSTNNGTLTYSISPALPAGLTFNTTTGAIGGTPTATQVATTHTITVSNGCSSTTATVNVTVYTALSALNYTTLTASYCVGAAITSNAVTGITGGGTITYAVSPSLPTGLSLNTSTGAVSGNPSVSAASASYTVTASNGACTTTKALTIVVNNNLSSSTLTYTTQSIVKCVNSASTTNSAALSPSTNNGTVAYSVSPTLPTGLTISTSNGGITGIPSVAQATLAYTITATSACGGSTSSIVNITINALPTIAVNSGTYCSGGTAIALTASGASTYAWSPSTGLSGTTGSNVNANPTSTTTYTVTGTDANSCVSTATSIVSNVFTPSAISISQTPSPVCSGDVATLAASGGVIASSPTQYSFSAVSETYSAITGTTLSSSAIGDDVGVGNLPIGFSFPYNGVSHSVFAASSNGLLQLSNTSTTISGFSGNALSSTANIIAPLWDDNNTTGGSIIYTTTGNAPNRILTVQWAGMHVAGAGSSSSATINLQAKLYENGDIKFVYGAQSATIASPSATIGISGGSGSYLSITPATAISSSTASSVAENISVNTNYLISGSAFIFTNPPLNLTWSPTTNLYTNSSATTAYTGGSATTVYALNTSTTQYTVSATNGACTSSNSINTSINALPTITLGTASAVCAGGTSSDLIYSASTGSPNEYMIDYDATANTAGFSDITTYTTLNSSPISLVIPAAASAGTYNGTLTVKNSSTGCMSTTNSFSVVLNAPVTIASSPANQVILPNDNATFSVNATGTGLTYQWEENTGSGWNTISNAGIYSGATTNTLTLTGVTTESGYQYRCVVSGTSPCAGATSSAATLTISTTAISAQPQNQSICNSSGSATFSVSTTGTPPSSYQWQLSTDAGATWANISGETSSSLSLTGLTTAESGYVYHCIINGTITSNTATLTVSVPSVSGTVSANQGICASTTPSSIALTGSTGTIQWQVSTDNSTFSDISGATSSTLASSTIGALTSTRYYRAIVTSGGCSAETSGVVTVTVTPTPNAGTLSGTQIICANATTTFSSNGDAGGAWTSANTAIATVNISTGVVTGVAAGTTTITYTITGTGGCNNATATRTVTVNAVPPISSATATPAAICAGSSVNLSAGSVAVSTGTSIASGSGTSTSSSYPSPFGNDYWGAKQQFIITAADLSAMGLIAGNITAVSFDITSVATTPLVNYIISAKHTTSAAFLSSGLFETGLTTLYSSASYTPSSNTGYSNNKITFGTPFNWNGTSNVVFEICFNNSAWTSNATYSYSTKAYNVSCYYYADASGICSQANGSYTSYNLPNMKFDGQIGTNNTANYTWSWNTTPAISAATGTTTAANGTNAAISQQYTVTATNATTGCANTATTSAITINPTPATPTANTTTICGAQNATCSVNGTGLSGNTYKWYTVPTGGTPITGQTGSSLSAYPVSATTTFYVSEANANCESGRVEVVQTVSTPPSVTASVATTPICAGQSTTLNATSANLGYTYVWSSSAGSTASVSISPATTTSYTVTATDASGGANNGCTTTASTSVTVNALPSGVSVSSSTICNGGVATIAYSPSSTVSTQIGTGTNSAGAANTPYRQSITTNSRVQYLLTATELNNAGLTGPTIFTSLGFNVLTVGTGAMPSYTISLANSNLTALTSNYVTTGFTTVFTASNLLPVAGINTHPFQTYFTWDGVSNIVVNICHSGTGGSHSFVSISSPAAVSTVGGTGGSQCSAISGATNLNRPNIYIGSTNSSTITWSPTTSLFTDAAATAAYTGTSATTVYAQPSATTTYTATATSAAGCTSSNTATITVNQPSVAPTAISGTTSICIGASTTLTATGGTLGTGANYEWGTGSVVGTNPIAGQTSATITVTPTTTTTYWVRIVNATSPCTATTAGVSAAVTVDPLNTWIGGNGNWSDPNNWCGGVPTSSTAVVIANNATITLNAGSGVTTQVASMTINSGATLVVATGEQLTLTGALVNNGAMIIETGGTFKQGTSVTGNGTYNVQQYLTGSNTGGVLDGRFWYMGVPLNVTRTSSFGDETTTNRAWTWSETGQAYSTVPNANVLTPTTGIVYRRGSNGTVNFNGSGALGTGLYAQDATLTGLTKTGAFYSGYHLLANPYTAYLDFEMMDAGSNNMSSTIWTRAAASANSMVFDTYNATSNLGVNPSGGTSNQYIAPMQAFWVRVAGNTGTTGNISMMRSMTSHNSTYGGLKSSTEYPAFARVNVVDGPKYDQTLVYLRDDQNNGVDAFDSEKMFATGLAQVYTMAAGKKLVMNGLKNNKKRISVPLYFDLPTSKVYELTLAEFNMENGIILLEDKQEGIIQDFTIHDHYAFYANSGTLNNRFVLHFYMPEVFNPYQAPSNDWVSQEPIEGGIFIGSDGRGKVLVELELPSETQTDHVQILNAAGQVIFEADLNGAQTEFDLEAATGIYLVKVTNGSTTEIKKIIIQH